MNNVLTRLVVLIVVAIFVCILFAAGFKEVSDGYIGVQTSTVGKERVLNETLKQGWYWRRPLMVSIISYPVTEQHISFPGEYENPKTFATSDKKNVSLKTHIYYQLQETNLVDLHKQYKNHYNVNNKIQLLFESAIEKIVTQHTRVSLFQEKRENLCASLKKEVEATFGAGIVVNNVVIEHLSFPNQYTAELNEYYPEKSTPLEIKKTCYSKDRKTLNINARVYYRVDSKNTEEVHNKLGKGFVQNFLLPLSESVLTATATNYDLNEIFAEKTRVNFSQAFIASLREKSKEHKLEIDNGMIIEVLFDSEYQRILNQIQKTEMELTLMDAKSALEEKQADNANKVKERERLNIELDAKATKNAEIIKAEGIKEAEVLKATGKAEALLKVQKIIAENPEILKYLYVDKISENVKVIVVPSDNGNLQIGDLMEKAEK